MASVVEVLDDGGDLELTLEELAATANSEHLAALGAIADAFEHAVLAGGALLSAQARVVADFETWLADNVRYSKGSAFEYMRMATFQEELRALGYTSYSAARAALRDLGLCRKQRYVTGENRGSATAKAPERELVERLVAEGCSLTDAADMAGVARQTARRWIEPGYGAVVRRRNNEIKRKRKAAEQALRDNERRVAFEKGLKSAPDVAGRSYEATTKMDQWLGAWREQAVSDEQRRAINKAHALRDQLMVAISEALGLGYTA